jgi:AraC family transcriptional regulator
MPGDTASVTSFRFLSEPRWYLWEGGFLLIARAQGEVPPHAHHAIQIVIGLDGHTATRGQQGDWQKGRGVIVRPDAVHSFDASGSLGAMLFVDPESSEGAWLASALTQPITIVPEKRIVSPAAELRTFVEQPFDGMDVQTLIRHCVHALSPGAPPLRRLDARVTRVIDQIRASDDLRIPLDQAADHACLSPSRFAHLFKQQLGLPFKRYMLWRKLTRAMVAVGSEETLAAAAHAADFADAAHLTRTFHQMFGVSPSALMRGDLARIDSPFDVTPEPLSAGTVTSLNR